MYFSINLAIKLLVLKKQLTICITIITKVKYITRQSDSMCLFLMKKKIKNKVSNEKF